MGVHTGECVGGMASWQVDRTSRGMSCHVLGFSNPMDSVLGPFPSFNFFLCTQADEDSAIYHWCIVVLIGALVRRPMQPLLFSPGRRIHAALPPFWGPDATARDLGSHSSHGASASEQAMGCFPTGVSCGVCSHL